MFNSKKNLFATNNNVYVVVDQFSKRMRVYNKEEQAKTYCKEMNKYTKHTGKEYTYYATVR